MESISEVGLGLFLLFAFVASGVAWVYLAHLISKDK